MPELTQDEIEKRIISLLEQSTIFKPWAIVMVTTGVYPELFTKRGMLPARNLEIFDLLCKLEDAGIVKDTVHLPSTDKVKVMEASRWVLVSKL